MTPERWQQLKILFARAVRLGPNEQSGLVRDLSASDAELAASLLSLIRHHETATPLLDGPILSQARIAEYLSSGMRTFHDGELIADRFRIEQFLGEGGMGEVYAAEDLELGGRVAVKTLRPALSRNEALVRQLKQETQVARVVTHRNVSRVFDLYRHAQAGADGRAVVFLTMELVQGKTLAERIQREGGLAISEALRIAEQIADGLSAAHRAGILHRDLKSGNILLEQDASGMVRAVVMDFGLACPTDLATGSQDIAATVAYASPEQLAGGALTAASDIYSFGVVLFEMVTGRLPFEGTKRESTRAPRELAPGLSARWNETILACLATDPLLRPASAEKVIALLKAGPLSRRQVVAGAATFLVVAAAGLVLTRPRVLNAEAIRCVKRGQDFAVRRNLPGLTNAVIEFQRAVQLEPGYVDAWIGLADAHSAMANFNFTDPSIALAAARKAAARAAGLDPRSARATGVLGYITSLDVHDWLNAEPYFLRAVGTDPKDSTIRLWYGAHLGKLGRSAAAIQQLQAGLDQTPSSFALNQQLATEYFRSRQFESYLRQAHELVRLQPSEASSHLALARALEWTGHYQEALASCEEARKYDASATALCFRATILYAMGDRAGARRDADEVMRYWSTKPMQTAVAASLFCMLGEPSTVMAMLNAGYVRGDSTVLTAPTTPYFDSMKGNSEYQQFLRRIGWSGAK